MSSSGLPLPGSLVLLLRDASVRVRSISLPRRRPDAERGGPFGQPGYPNYVTAMLLGATGFWVSRIAQDWLVLELTHSVTAVGIASALQFAPLLVLGLLGGVLADKLNVKTLLIIAQAMAAVVSTTIAVLTILGHIQAWHIYAGAATIGLASVIEQPSRATMIGSLSGRHLRSALSFNMLAFQVAGLIGPALATLVIGQAGIGWAFFANALGCLVTIALLVPVRVHRPQRASADKVSLRQGLASIGERPEVGRAMVLAAIMSVFTLCMPLMYAAFAQKEFGLGVGGYSLLNSLNAAGAGLGALLSSQRTGTARLRTLTPLLAGVGVLLTGAALAPSIWVFAPLAALAAGVSVTFSLGANALVQSRTPAQVQGRVMSLYILIVLGGQSAANPLIGRFIDTFGARPVLAVVGIATVAAVALVARSIARTHELRLVLTRDSRYPTLRIVD